WLGGGWLGGGRPPRRGRGGVIRHIGAQRRPGGGRHGGAVGIAVARVLGQRGADHLVQPRGQAGNRVRGTWRRGVEVCLEDLTRGGARERQCAGEHLVEGHAEGVDVAAVVGLATVDLFGGDIGEGNGELARGGEVRVVVAAGDAEVGDEDVVAAVAVFGDQQIGRLDV